MKKLSIKKGFTIVETLVAISILLIGLAAAFTVAQSGIQTSSYAKDRITAFFLAQEAMEAIKNTKDSNLLAINAADPAVPNWLTNISASNGHGGACGPVNSGPPCDFNFQSRSSAFIPCIDNNDCSLQNINLNGDVVLGHTGVPGDYSRFKRKIYIDEFGSGVEAKVTVRVTWGPGDATHSFEVVENIFSWF